jgi:hypothetical protein
MLPINAAHPKGKNNIVLAIHARSIGELRSSSKHTARGHVSVPVPVPAHQPCEERQSGGYDWNEAIANQRHLVEGKVFPQQIDVDRTISIAIQHEAAPISTLRQMVWNICGHNPSQSPHSLNTISANGFACCLIALMWVRASQRPLAGRLQT